jgi:hypothetical protein
MTKCLKTGSEVWSVAWGREPACGCSVCIEHRDGTWTNRSASAKRQCIAVKFEIDLPLKEHEVKEAVNILEGLLAVLRGAIRESPEPHGNAA